MVEQNDGTATLEQQRKVNPGSEPLRERTDVVSTTIEDKAHLPNAPQGGTGASGVALEELPADVSDAAQDGEEFYKELARYNAERRPETSSWKTTQDDELPQDTSSTAGD
jgi:hypothetical protein